MIDLFDKLIDRCIQLIKAKQERNRLYFDEFVSPTFEAFEEVHRSYMDTFVTCRKLLTESQGFDHAGRDIAWRVQEQILYRSDFRTKVYQLSFSAGEANRSKPSWLEESLAGFLNGIREYLIVNNFNMGHPEAMYNNQRWASHVLHRLRELESDATLTDEDRRYVATASLDAAVAEMQFMYSQVCGAYYTLKAQLVR